MAEERVQKILARAGYGSRRASEELITAGRVRINGQPAVLGSKADPQRDTITVDNQPIAKAEATRYIAINKPTGVLSEVSPEEPRDTVRDLVPVPGHLFIVGRLDMESEGLILLTNDGELANRLTHPRYGHEKEYRVLMGTRPDERQMDAWRHGIVLEDGYRTAPAQIRLEGLSGKGAWVRVILREGRKRQIREMGKQIGLLVLRIQRIRIGSLLLGDLKPGEWRDLRPEEVRALKVNKPYREVARGAVHETRRDPRYDLRPGTARQGARSGTRSGSRSGGAPGGTKREGGPRSAGRYEDRRRDEGAPGGNRSGEDRPASGGPASGASSGAPGRSPSRGPASRPGRAPARPGGRPASSGRPSSGGRPSSDARSSTDEPADRPARRPSRTPSRPPRDEGPRPPTRTPRREPRKGS